jgi:hypothetical protein
MAHAHVIDPTGHYNVVFL